MKICYLVHDLSPLAGYGRYASSLIEGMRARGVDATVLKEQDDGFEGVPLMRRGMGVFPAAWRARPYLRGADIIHALDVNPFGIVAALANWRYGVPFALSALGTYSVAALYHRKTRWLARYALRSADAVTAISRFTRDEVTRRASWLKGKVCVITPGIEVDRFSRLPRDYPAGGRFIVSVGSLSYRKGYHVSIPAFARARQRLRDLRYVIVGGKAVGRYPEQLKELVHDLRVEDAVEFRGGISDKELRQLYRDASLFLLASVNAGHHFEGFGMVFVEAASAGLPVVGTLGNGIEDAVEDGANGILVPQDDVEATAGAIVDTIADRERWQEMSKAGRAWAKHHTLERMINQTLEVYRSLV